MNSSIVLGLDVGSNSIGWALIDEAEQRIIATGVRIFPEGVNRDAKEAEVSKNEARRTARMARRQAARRAGRTRRLRSATCWSGIVAEGGRARAGRSGPNSVGTGGVSGG